MSCLRIRYLVIHDGEDVSKIVDDNIDWFDLNECFESIVFWSNREISKNKIIWVRCKGHPYMEQTPIKIMMSIYEGTKSLCYSYSRLYQQVTRHA